MVGRSMTARMSSRTVAGNLASGTTSGEGRAPATVGPAKARAAPSAAPSAAQRASTTLAVSQRYPRIPFLICCRANAASYALGGGKPREFRTGARRALRGALRDRFLIRASCPGFASSPYCSFCHGLRRERGHSSFIVLRPHRPERFLLTQGACLSRISQALPMIWLEYRLQPARRSTVPQLLLLRAWLVAYSR